MCVARAGEETVCLAAKLAIQKDLDYSVSVAEAEMWLPAKPKPFMEAEAIAVNARTTVEIDANPGIAMGDAHNR